MKKLCFFIIVILFLHVFATAQNWTKTNKTAFVKIETTEGIIKVKLYDDTPEHKYNFMLLVKNRTYEGLLFHRVIKDFMIQGGDPESKDADSTKSLGSGGLGYAIDAEIRFPEHFHKRGALAAARTDDNVNPMRTSSACQFYIVTGKTVTDKELDLYENNINNQLLPQTPLKYTEEQRRIYKTFGGTPHLDGYYTVFGEVVQGFDVLEKIQSLETDKRNRPTKDIKILKMKLYFKHTTK
ncbi:MAG: peptidylprolyl isomerase [Prevotellaceae bacterium]|jgi:cyclophilin family peptidyl-prolyl cis-trans isomerase|nr:peptidylprolyl isomerase [Prevotellaceae bacterium]